MCAIREMPFANGTTPVDAPTDRKLRNFGPPQSAGPTAALLPAAPVVARIAGNRIGLVSNPGGQEGNK